MWQLQCQSIITQVDREMSWQMYQWSPKAALPARQCPTAGEGYLSAAHENSFLFPPSDAPEGRTEGSAPGHLSSTHCHSPEHLTGLGSCHFRCDFLRCHLLFLFDSSMQSKDETVKVFGGYQQELGEKAALKFHLRVIYRSRLHACCHAGALCAGETFFSSRRDWRGKSCSFLSVAGTKQFMGNGSRINL